MGSNHIKKLYNLGLNSLDTLLLHSSGDLKAENSKSLLNWLISLKEKELARNIGISIYEKKDIENLSLKEIDIVQIPLSIFNQKLIYDGTIEEIKKNNCLIQVRSVFTGITFDFKYKLA